MTAPGLQFMPEQTPETIAALREDIREHGVQTPVVVDQHGRILDGNNRAAIADELDLEYPTETVHVKDDDEAEDRAIALNLKRRTISQAQMRDLIADQIERHPEMSDRAIAKRLGCSHPTVAAVRKGGKSYRPDPAAVEAARARADQMITAVGEWHQETAAIVYSLMSNGIEQVRLIRALRNGKIVMANQEPTEAWEIFASRCYETLIDMVLDEAVVAETYAQAEGLCFLHLDEEFVERTLESLADPFAIRPQTEGSDHGNHDA